MIKTVDKLYDSLGHVYNVNYYCYYGFFEFLNPDYVIRLFYEVDIVNNIVFNAGFMYTDLTMMVIGIPGYTEVDYLYYISFYIADFFLRFLFRTERKGYCWLPWNSQTCTGMAI